MKTVITYGTFDLFHYGHYKLLKRAKELGDYLIVGVSTDEMCKSKGKTTILNVKERMEIVSSLRFVDKVIIEENMEQKVSDVKKYDANIFVLGNDYATIFPEMPEYSALIKNGCKVIFLPRTQDISTTKLKKCAIEQFGIENV